MLTLLFLLQAASGDIVITGKRLVEAHAACVKGGCTPLRDAQAVEPSACADDLASDLSVGIDIELH
ncbi:hypothetical protein SPMU_09530 [Sphingomonas mucosissima]|uniref:Uncharacterized protein n=1 Tax=Sphingomonas mucosissima TaxID=370959 RepID=A0A245ZSA1_9SPHN|nr:hypothetical protein SPMU_09530 [Sphingomonas mucosissima]